MNTFLNPEQKRAVDHKEGPLMVLAGAGTGKTRVLVHRIAALIRNGVKPHRILAVTFTNKAAGEMRERIGDMLPGQSYDIWMGTFHSICARLLRIHHEDAGISKDFTIFDTDDQVKLMNRLIKENELKDTFSAKQVLSIIDSAKNKGKDPNDNVPSFLKDSFGMLYKLYDEALRFEDALDFNDLLLRVRELFSVPNVAAQLRARFEFILVDEFQDTNQVQYDLVKNLILPESNSVSYTHLTLPTICSV